MVPQPLALRSPRRATTLLPSSPSSFRSPLPQFSTGTRRRKKGTFAHVSVFSESFTSISHIRRHDASAKLCKTLQLCVPVVSLQEATRSNALLGNISFRTSGCLYSTEGVPKECPKRSKSWSAANVLPSLSDTTCSFGPPLCGNAKKTGQDEASPRGAPRHRKRGRTYSLRRW